MTLTKLNQEMINKFKEASKEIKELNINLLMSNVVQEYMYGYTRTKKTVMNEINRDYNVLREYIDIYNEEHGENWVLTLNPNIEVYKEKKYCTSKSYIYRARVENTKSLFTLQKNTKRTKDGETKVISSANPQDICDFITMIR